MLGCQGSKRMKKVTQSRKFSRRHNCVRRRSIWQLAGRDSRENHGVKWATGHADVLWWSQRWVDKAAQMIAPWTPLHPFFCFIFHRPRRCYYPRGERCEGTSLPAVCGAASCSCSRSICLSRTTERPATGSSLIPTRHRSKIGHQDTRSLLVAQEPR